LRSYGYLPCRTNKESEQMKPPNRNTTETFIGAMYEREDLLRREAQNSRMGRVAYRMAWWVRMIARVAFVLLVVGLLVAITVGPGRAIDWLGAYLIPVGVITASLALLVWTVKRLPNPPYRNWWQ
jgi:hypothetical protein